ncbi:hypothetical protein F5Y19DRAFT_467414 [Xylariaceae sp. FL1651]|nr:hypothetical protein F5Y19DRAFT_467414 [Xylariaceae sp. FL1651]
MPSYVITGASRGIGYEFLSQLSNDRDNTVIGLVRNKATTEEKLAKESKARPNVHILQADITDYNTLKQAAEDTANITGGSLDYLIANAGAASKYDFFDGFGVLGEQPKELEAALHYCFNLNVVGNIHFFNLFMPLILKGQAKKVIAISSAMADNDLTAKFDIDWSAAYAISKAALNTAVAKFSAEYAKHGVLVMGICPGMVDTGYYDNLTEEQMKKVPGQIEKFKRYAPHFTGPSTTESAVKDVMSVIRKSSVENGDGGAFLSHLGTKRWL